MQDKATQEQAIVHHAIEFIGARDAHKAAAPADKDAARNVKHQRERELDKAVKARKKPP